MPAADKAPDGFVYNAVDQLRHDLKTPLTTIYARAYLLGRAIRRSPSLSDEERGTMLERVAAIETAVRDMSALIDAISLPSRDEPPDSVAGRR
jgi:signal transduction histidine kinase